MEGRFCACPFLLHCLLKVQEISRFVLWPHIFDPVWSSWICLTPDLLSLKFGFSCMWSDCSDSANNFTLRLSFLNFVRVCTYGNLCPIRKQTHQHSPAPVTTGCFPPNETSASLSVCSPVRKKPLVLSRWTYFSPVYSSFSWPVVKPAYPQHISEYLCVYRIHLQALFLISLL